MPSNDQYIGAEDVAEQFGVPLKTVYQWNHAGNGPPHYRIGRHVRYRVSEVEAWAESRRVSR